MPGFVQPRCAEFGNGYFRVKFQDSFQNGFSHPVAPGKHILIFNDPPHLAQLNKASQLDVFPCLVKELANMACELTHLVRSPVRS